MTPTELHPSNIFTVDVEDWFHINGSGVVAYPIAQWAGLESRVEGNFRSLLDDFSEAGISTTCFFLGWVAERFPHLVREAADRGHELASHGYGHEVLGRQSQKEFAADIRRSKDVLEQTSGTRVVGYRAPSFSITPDTRWAFDELIAAGFEYDSSVFPASRDLGGNRTAFLAPHRIKAAGGSIVEMPVSVAQVLCQRMCFFGGGYLRLFPYSVIRAMARRVNSEGRPVIYYIHPREIDPHHPRLALSPLRRWKCYVNIKSTRRKLRALLHTQRIVSMRRWIELNADGLPTMGA